MPSSVGTAPSRRELKLTSPAGLLQTEGPKQAHADAPLRHELAEVLRYISSALLRLSTDLPGEFTKEQNLKDVRGSGGRKRGAGVVVIVGDVAHPLASWAVPLTEAVLDGNPAVIVAAPGAIIVPSAFAAKVDASAYPLLWTESPATLLSELPRNAAGLVGPADRLPTAITLPLTSGSTSSASVRPVGTAPVPVIVDQSVLPGGKPLTPRQAEAGLVPPQLTAVANNIAAAVTVRSASLGTPTYVLVHENVAEPLMSALNTALPAHIKARLTELFDTKPAARAFLSGQRAGFADFLPVYAVRSLDHAMDFVSDDVPPPAAAYVFAAHQFGAYAFNFLAGVGSVYLNAIPAEALALGPYAHGEGFSFTTVAHVRSGRLVSKVEPPQAVASLEAIEKIKARQIVQHPGHRIDFFGGSEYRQRRRARGASTTRYADTDNRFPHCCGHLPGPRAGRRRLRPVQGRHGAQAGLARALVGCHHHVM